MKRLIVVCLMGMIICGCGLRSEPPQDQKAPGQKTSVRAANPATMPEQSSDLLNQQPFVTLAIDLLKKGEVAGAVRALDEAIKANPHDIQAYTLLGQTYMHVNELDRAVDTFSAAVRVDPENGEMYYMLAFVNGLRGERELAIVDAENALRIFEKERDDERFKRTLVLLHGLSQE